MKVSLAGVAARRAKKSTTVPRDRESGSAVADFAMVSGLLSLLFLAVFQLGLALHIRNTLISCASEGARYGARADATPQDGVVLLASSSSVPLGLVRRVLARSVALAINWMQGRA